MQVDKKVEELTLLLMYLTSWEENDYYDNSEGKIENGALKHCWKGYDFDVLNELTNKGLLFQGNYKNKSVTLTKEGEVLAEKLVNKYLK